MTEVQNDPDRVLHPLRAAARRRASSASPGTRRWTTSASASARSATATAASAVGWYMGNPGAFSYSHPLWVKGFLDAIGSPHSYTASSQDVSNRFAASSFLYGSPFLVPIPDLERTDLLFVVGANPLVSHGSVLSAPRVKDQLHAITERGGRVVVVDPRRSETARAFEHVADQPRRRRLAAALDARGDLRRGAGGPRRDRAPVDRESRPCAGWSPTHPPEATEARSGVPAATVRTLARDLAGADRAAVYGRTGSCLGRNGTLVAFLLDALNVVTGNLDREGGAMFGDPPIDFERVAHRLGLATYAQGALADRRLARGARLAAGLGDGEGDHHAGRGPDPGAVRLRRQPGALGAQRRRARGGDGGARALGLDRPLHIRHRPPLPTSSFRRRRCSSARTSRCRSSPCSRRRSSR